MNGLRQKAWVCAVCGYIHYGPEPPDECPVCGAGPDQFTLQEAAQPAVAAEASAPLRILIVGAGIAGVSAAEAARLASPRAELVLLSDEDELPYFRINLTRYLAGEIAPERFALHPEEWYREQAITLRRGVQAASLHPAEHRLTLSGGEMLTYDRLVLAAGARPFVPPIPGANLSGVHTLRTRSDAEQILAGARGQPVVCIGGGLLGLETAAALARQGAQVTVLETLDWLMPRQLNRAAAGIFQAFVESLGIAVRTGIKVKELQGEARVRSVLLEDGSRYPAEVVVLSAGVRPRTDLAAQGGLEVKGGILVDPAMRTSHPDVFAAGDCAEFSGILYGTWTPSLAQGNIAGASAAGVSAAFLAQPRSALLKVLGIDLFSVGRIAPQEGDVLIEDGEPGRYTGFLFNQGKLAGAILLGDATAAPLVKQAVEDQADCSALLAGRPSAARVLEHFQAA